MKIIATIFSQQSITYEAEFVIIGQSFRKNTGNRTGHKSQCSTAVADTQRRTKGVAVPINVRFSKCDKDLLAMVHRRQ